MDADNLLNELFLRKMSALSAENMESIDELREFYEKNEQKLIALCARHQKDKEFQSLRLFVSFEFREHHPEMFPPRPEIETPTESGAGRMIQFHAGENVETKGNPDGVITSATQ